MRHKKEARYLLSICCLTMAEVVSILLFYLRIQGFWVFAQCYKLRLSGWPLMMSSLSHLSHHIHEIANHKFISHYREINQSTNHLSIDISIDLSIICQLIYYIHGLISFLKLTLYLSYLLCKAKKVCFSLTCFMFLSPV